MNRREVRHYLRLARRWWWLLIVSILIPTVTSYYLFSKRPNLYQASVTVMVGSALRDPNPDMREVNLSNTLANAYAEVVTRGPVTEAVIERLGLDRTPDKLASQIKTVVHSGAYLLEIQVTDTDPEVAALIANALADELIRRSPASSSVDPKQEEFIRNQLDELQTKIGVLDKEIADLTDALADLTSAAEIQDAQDRIAKLDEVKSLYQSTYAGLLEVYRADAPNVLSVFDPAVPPKWPLPSRIRLVVAVAGGAGLALALAAIFLMDYLDTSFQWEGNGGQAVLDLPVLGTVPQVSARDAELSFNPLSPVSEGVRAMRANVFLLRPNRPFRTFLVTSPGSSEGKTFIVANLAVTLATAGNRVIVVDADLRKPSLHESFDRPNVSGLAEVLAGDVAGEGNPMSVPLQDTDFDGLSLLSAGRPPTDPATLLTSPRLPRLLETLRERADVILFDSPPVESCPDATILATLVEGTILVVGVGVTRREQIREAKTRLLAHQGASLLGVTVNRVSLRGSYYNYYYGGYKARAPRRRGKPSEDGWLSLGEAADRLGISRSKARKWCRTGRLPATRSKLWWRVRLEDVERLGRAALRSEASGAGAPGGEA